jgi:uncharacterized membrane protein YidH (DUF202 family)
MSGGATSPPAQQKRSQEGNNMRITLADRESIISGLVFTAIGVFTCYLAADLKFGTPSRMGPGFMPTVLGAILALLGLAILLTGVWKGVQGNEASTDDAPPLELRSLLIIAASISVFAAALPHLGLIVAVPLLVIISSFAAEAFRWRGTILLAVGLAVVTYAIFVVGLKVDIPATPW